MATTQRYISHLLQNLGITPACSEEERAAADDIAHIFAQHGFEPEVQEFGAKDTKRLVTAVLGIMVFVGAVLCGVGGAVGVIGLLLAIAAAVIYTLERQGKQVLSNLGAGGLSQNVIAYHKATGPLASPRNRPVVIVAHYDSPRADIFSQEPYAQYRPLVTSLLPAAMLVPAIVAFLRLFPFPDPLKIVLWLVAIVAALVPLANAVAIILNKFVLPYTSGSVCNKSSVAAMLGVMEAVAPFAGTNEFPHDIPADEYFDEQRRLAEQQRLALEAEMAARYPEEQQQEEEVADGGEASEEAPSAQEGQSPITPSDEASPSDGSSIESISEAPAPESAADAGTSGTAIAEDLPAAESPTPTPPAPGETVVMPSIEAADDETQAMDAAPVNQGVTAAEEVSEAPSGDPVAVPSDDEAATTDAVPAGEQVEAPAAAMAINAHGNVRYGAGEIRALGMLPDSCVIEYEGTDPVASSEAHDAPAGEVSAPEDPDATAGPGIPAAPVQDRSDAEAPSSLDSTMVQPALEPVQDDEDPYDAYDGEEDEAFAPLPSSAYDLDNEYDDAYGPKAAGIGQVADRMGINASGLADAFATASAGASKFFGEAVRRGKEALSTIEAKMHAHDERDRAEDDPQTSPAQTAAPADVPLDKTVSVPAVTVPASDDMASEQHQPAVEPAQPADGVPEPVPEGQEPPVSAPVPGDASSGAGAEERPAQPEDEDPTEVVEAAPDQTLIASKAEEEEQTEVVSASRQAEDPSATIVAPVPAPPRPTQPVETVDSLMAEINGAASPVQQPAPRRRIVVPDPSQPSIHEPTPVNRAALFDLPDPASTPTDPFVSDDDVKTQPTSQHGFTVISADTPAETIGTISSGAPIAQPPAAEPRRRGLGGLFHRKKSDEQSMSDYLGLSDSYDAKDSGREIGSWDNFEDFDDDWKGGAAGVEGVSEDDLRDAITSMGDDELLGHDIWFVATGASEFDHAGIKAFLRTHRDKLRGVFLINLECVGSGQVAMLATEGDHRVLKGDKRIMNLVTKVSGAFHHELGAVEMPYLSTDAYAAMDMSLRSLTIAGIDGPKLACSHSEEDVSYNVDVDNINMVADVVTEVIRRS